jgi:hypothetical protein
MKWIVKVSEQVLKKNLMDKLKTSKDQLESIRDFFFQFCDIQNLAIFFNKIKKIIQI